MALAMVIARRQVRCTPSRARYRLRQGRGGTYVAASTKDDSAPRRVRQRSLPLSSTDPVDLGVQEPPTQVLEVVRGRGSPRLTEEDPQAALPAGTHAVSDHRGLDPAAAELAEDASVAEAGNGTHVKEHPGRRRHAVDATEIRAQRPAVRAPLHERLDDVAKPRAALLEARVRDACVLRGVLGAHALHGETLDGSHAWQRAVVVAVDVLVRAFLGHITAALQE